MTVLGETLSLVADETLDGGEESCHALTISECFRSVNRRSDLHDQNVSCTIPAMTDEALIQQLPGFQFTDSGRIIYGAGPSRFKDVWQVHNFDVRHLTTSERNNIARVRTTPDPVFLTPRSGRAGWSVRTSFPRELPARKIPFLVVFGGEIVRLAPTNEQVRI